MGCSPPSSWYEEQTRFSLAQARHEHQDRVAKLLRDIEQMAPEQKQRFRAALDAEIDESARLP